MMFKSLWSLFGTKKLSLDNERERGRELAPDEVVVDGLAPFPLVSHMNNRDSFPFPDWDKVYAWVGGAGSEPLRGQAWSACERAWLLHLRDALGAGYHLDESKEAAVLSTLSANVSRAALDYMGRTLVRVTKVLDGLAQVPAWGKDILIVFEDAERYYSYVSRFYADEAGEFAYSSGMHISAGCSHYVTVKADLSSVEPVIVHEMTHGLLAHLPLPTWLNEGLAVNTEWRLAGRDSSIQTLREMRQKHLAFWGEDEIQEFWSGKSFYRSGDSNSLSYDMARILVEFLARDWERFKHFVLHADRNDGGTRAAEKQLGMDLGEMVCSLLEKPVDCRWAPDPQKWEAHWA